MPPGRKNGAEKAELGWVRPVGCSTPQLPSDSQSTAGLQKVFQVPPPQICTVPTRPEDLATPDAEHQPWHHLLELSNMETKCPCCGFPLVPIPGRTELWVLSLPARATGTGPVGTGRGDQSPSPEPHSPRGCCKQRRW